LENALRDRDDRVLGTATGGERVGLRLGRDVEPWHRHVVAPGQVLDDLVEAGGLLTGDGLGPGGGDGDLVAEPERASHEEQRQHRADDQAAGAEDGTDADEHRTEEGKEHERLEGVDERASHLTSPLVCATPRPGRAFPRIVRVL
jgi:hypothetical protein